MGGDCSISYSFEEMAVSSNSNLLMRNKRLMEMLMVTYEGLFQFVIMLIALISLIIKIFKRK
jgi:hypothetical protein